MTSSYTPLNHKRIHLPFKRKVLFVDWHGVISNDLFWHNESPNSEHYLNRKSNLLQENIFKDTSLIRNWMKGNVDCNYVIEYPDIGLTNFLKARLSNRLHNYFSNINVNHELLSLLFSLRDNYFLVLATDNMDCFFNTLNNFDYLNYFDCVLSSNVIGVLKGENPVQFFGEWLSSHSLEFENALLIDDSDKNCSLFQDLGGNTIHYKEQGIEDISTFLKKFLDL